MITLSLVLNLDVSWFQNAAIFFWPFQPMITETDDDSSDLAVSLKDWAQNELMLSASSVVNEKHLKNSQKIHIYRPYDQNVYL